MSGFIYWLFRGIGYLFFFLCALVWIGTAVGVLYLLFRVIVYLLGSLFAYTLTISLYAVAGYLLFLVGRLFVNIADRFLHRHA